MNTNKQHISIIGSTGSVGKSAVNLIAAHKNRFFVEFLSAYSNYRLLARQAKEVNAKFIVVINPQYTNLLKQECYAIGCKSIVCAAEDITECINSSKDMVLIANNGVDAIDYILSSIQSNKTILLANKEALVCAGNLIQAELGKYSAKIVPVDSEHNAIYQLINKNTSQCDISQLIITASGGPFYNLSEEQLAKITKKDALKHPTWQMGEIISINCATLVNKALEIAEAFYLFNLSEVDKIKAIYHPQSLIHGIVKYNDGTFQLVAYAPDMQIALAYALSPNSRFMFASSKNADVKDLSGIILEDIKSEKNRPINLIKSCLKEGGNKPCVFNIANELAVNAFLLEKIPFSSIITTIEYCLNKRPYNDLKSYESLKNEVIETTLIVQEFINKI